MKSSAHAPLLERLATCERVLLTGPSEPDGDSVGACLALQRMLRRPGARVDVAGTVARRYAWMPGASEVIPDASVAPIYDAVVVLDGDRHRLTATALAAFDAAPVKGLIDHHASTRLDGYTHTWLERHGTSTCEMLYDALVERGDPIDADLATLLYVGAIFDTGGFRYSNTTPATHHMAARLLETGIDHASITTRVLMERSVAGLRAAGLVFGAAELHADGQVAVGMLPLATQARLGMAPGDLEGLVDALVYTERVEVAALLIERAPGKVKASLRSRGRVDVAQLAHALDPCGGGHTKAAGVTLPGSLAEARDRIVAAVAARLGA